MYPTDRRYSKEHEWILVEGNTGTIGITAFAQEQLGDIVFVELPEVGAKVGKDEVLGSIESVKAVSEIFSPVSGTVLEINSDLDESPELVNGDPHGRGWYCKLELGDAAEVSELMEAAAYEKLASSS